MSVWRVLWCVNKLRRDFLPAPEFRLETGNSE